MSVSRQGADEPRRRFELHGLRTVVGQRVLTLFLLCAILPMAIVMAESYRRVANQLEAQSMERVRTAANSAGMTILQELGFLEQQLIMLGNAVTRSMVSAQDIADGLTQLSDIQIIADAVAPRALRGQQFAAPALSADQREHLVAGRTLLMTSAESRANPIILARAVQLPNATGGAAAIVWARPRMDAVFRNARIYAEGEPFDGLCVVADVPLHCSTELVGVPALITSATGAESSRAARTDLSWRAPDEEEHVIHVWHLFLKAHFGAPGWSIAVGMPRRVAFEALGDFRVMFVLVILAAISIVFLLSNDQIRRTLGPLQALTHAAMKIRDGHFGERIAVQSKDEFGELGSAFNHMSIELGAQFDTLRTLHSLDRAVLTSLDEDVVVNELLERGGSVLNAMAGAVVLLDRDASGRGRAYAASSGNAVGRSFRTSDVAHEWLHQTLQGQPSVIVPVGSLDGSVLDTPPLNTATEGAFLILALRTSGAGLIGALVFHVRADISDTSTFERARQIADQSSVALTAVRLVAELQDFGWGALTALARTIDAKSPWTSGHSERVASLSRAIAEEIGLPPDQIEILRRAALLHDIGKLAIPPAILDKAGRLTEEERVMLETHVNVGVRILEPIRAFADILPAIQDHHERLNGSGYPNGKRGDEIDPLGRIIAVADVFDAVVSDRPYRVGMAEAHVLQMLRDEAGVFLDAAVVDAFARVLTLSMVTEIPLVERGSSTRSSEMIRREDT